MYLEIVCWKTKYKKEGKGKKKQICGGWDWKWIRCNIETEIHELPVDSSRSLGNTNGNICQWHIAGIVVTSENRVNRSPLCLPRLAFFVPPRGLPFHRQPLLRKSSPFGFKWGLVHTMPRVIYPLGASSGSTRRNRSVEKANGNGDSFLDTSHPLQLSVPRIEITLGFFY